MTSDADAAPALLAGKPTWLISQLAGQAHRLLGARLATVVPDLALWTVRRRDVAVDEVGVIAPCAPVLVAPWAHPVSAVTASPTPNARAQTRRMCKGGPQRPR